MDAGNCAIDIEAWPQTLRWAKRRGADLVSFDDDFPSAFTFELIRNSALRAAADAIAKERLLSHFAFPGVYIRQAAEQFNCLRLKSAASQLPPVDCPYFTRYREAKLNAGSGLPKKCDWFYDTHRFVYELALEQLKPGGRVVDISSPPSQYFRNFVRKSWQCYFGEIERLEIIGDKFI